MEICPGFETQGTVLQVHGIRCVWKTPFHKSRHKCRNIHYLYDTSTIKLTLIVVSLKQCVKL